MARHVGGEGEDEGVTRRVPLSGRTADSDASRLPVSLRRGLADVDYAQGRNVAVEFAAPLFVPPTTVRQHLAQIMILSRSSFALLSIAFFNPSSAGEYGPFIANPSLTLSTVGWTRNSVG